jgi:F420H(2)-dependent quinone reductase
MPLTGVYEPSAASWARDQVDLCAPEHPVWFYNLTANPHVELQDGPVKKDYQAREVQGGERATWWERAVTAWPDYAAYQQKTTRTIPVFVLTPIDA